MRINPADSHQTALQNVIGRQLHKVIVSAHSPETVCSVGFGSISRSIHSKFLSLRHPNKHPAGILSPGLNAFLNILIPSSHPNLHSELLFSDILQRQYVAWTSDCEQILITPWTGKTGGRFRPDLFPRLIHSVMDRCEPGLSICPHGLPSIRNSN
ncbi:hypothetical protein BO71DRAFT_62688 [Aspergillus ellipticus CBS 707.79]|uniref:Uncharacterized protein n=1 Tax=Aspergillus ellipticus CBS 707.79 TaxID=1448320 RepID=A0A319D0S6_9EURO|nr:hypothetical protein BO71DRAFT_62688 [Aspergillus ellipticus CBS 707.79]